MWAYMRYIYIACLTNTKNQTLIFVDPSSWKYNDSWFHWIFRVSIRTGCLRETCKPFAKKLLEKKSHFERGIFARKEARCHAFQGEGSACKEKGKRQGGESWQAAPVLFTQALVFSFTPALTRSFWRHVHLHAWENLHLFDKNLWKSQNKNFGPFS